MIDRMGDKASAKATMIEAGCPLFLVQLVLESFEQAQELAIFGYQ
jgi:acetyl-CoA carboxylase biotin carboxylase subunit